MASEAKRSSSKLSEISPETSGEKHSQSNIDILQSARQQFEGSLDTIKEILIGEHAREIRKKMDLLEERVSRELSNSQHDTNRRFDSLESFVRKEFLLLREDVKKEQEERSGSVDQVSGELKNSSKSFDNKITQVNQLLSSRFSDLRDQMLNESHSLSEEIIRKYREIYSEIEKTSAHLEVQKPDRQFIAALLIKMAGALQVEPLGESNDNVTEFKTREIKKSG